jgi:hypothetical protein
MASFTDLVRAQRQSGKSAVTSLSGAYNQQLKERYDPRNALFTQKGLMTALFPSLKGYQASAVSGKSPSSMMTPEISGSPSALSSIARDSKISARNSMMLPSIAKNMAQMVRIWGGTPAKYFEGAKQREEKYESKFGGGRKAGPGLGKTAGGGGFNILGMLGGALSGIGSVAGSLLGGAASIVGSIFGGIGSLVGGAFRGIFGVLSGALGNMGFMGVVLAGVVGFALYSLYKALDFSKLGGGIGDSLSSIKEALSGLYKELDGMTGGKLGTFIDDTQKMFKQTVDKIAAGMQTAINLFKDLGTAVIKDMYGFIYNIFKENQGKVLGMVTIGALAAFAGVGGLKGAAVMAAISAAMAAYGALSSERSVEEVRSENEGLKRELEKTMKDGRQVATYDASGNVTGYETAGQRASNIQDKIRENEAFIREKEARTSNTQAVLNRMNAADIGLEYQQRLAERQAQGQPTPVGGASSFSYDKKVTFNSLSREQQNQLMVEQANREGSTKKGTVGFRHNNPGNIIAKSRTEVFPEQAKFGGVPGETITYEGNTRTFVRFPNWQAGWEAQRDLWSRKYGNMDLQMAIKKWVNPSQSEMASGAYGNYERSLMKVAGATGTPTPQAPENQVASNQATPPTYNPTKAASAAGTTAQSSSMSDSIATLLYDQVEALDRMMGGQLRDGSIKYSDMLRDITKEFMNNPTFVDNSQTVNNSTQSQSGPIASAYNQDATNLLVGRVTSIYHII